MMQVWKRRFAALVAVGAGSAGLMMSSTAGAQTSPPTSQPSFTFPTFTIPTSPTFTIPPPTMPPPSPTTSTPPPTMPPVTSPPTSVPDSDDVIEDLLDNLENLIEEGEAGYEQFQELLDQLRAALLG